MDVYDVYGYEIVKSKGKGAYANVYKARPTAEARLTTHTWCRDRDFVALKTFLPTPYTPERGCDVWTRQHASREVTALRHLGPHPNIVRLLHLHHMGNDDSPVDYLRSTLVLEYVPVNLYDFPLYEYPTIHRARGMLRRIMRQLLQAVAYCHSREYVHRDISSGNVLLLWPFPLLENNGVKLADFGMAIPCREIEPIQKDQLYIQCTLPYRAVELLVGGRPYGKPMDVWSCGIIFISLLSLTWNRFVPYSEYFSATSETGMLCALWTRMGVPYDDVWPGIEGDYHHRLALRCMKADPLVYRGSVAENIGVSRWNLATPAAADLLDRLLTMDPDHRITAEEALAHEYFSEAEERREFSTQYLNREWVPPPAADTLAAAAVAASAVLSSKSSTSLSATSAASVLEPKQKKQEPKQQEQRVGAPPPPPRHCAHDPQNELRRRNVRRKDSASINMESLVPPETSAATLNSGGVAGMLCKCCIL